jgi:hypothetical protein
MLKGILEHHGLTEKEQSQPQSLSEEEQKEQELIIKLNQELFNLEKATEVVNAIDIDEKTYELIKRKYELTQDERRQVQKYRFLYDFNGPILTPELFLELNDKRHKFKNAEELYQHKNDMENYIIQLLKAYGIAKPQMETVERLTSNSIVSKYCKLYHLNRIYQAYGFDGPFDDKIIKVIPYEQLKQFIVDNLVKIDVSFGQAKNKRKLKEFQELDISLPKSKQRIVQYLNDKIEQMIGTCGKIGKNGKRKGYETYGINGIEKYYTELGVQFYESKSVRFLKQNQEIEKTDEIIWDEVEEIQLVFVD